MDPCAQTYAHLDQVAKDEAAKPSTREPRFNPSSISKCARQLAYQNLQTPKDIPEGAGFLQLYSRPGDFYHDEVRCLMHEAGCEMRTLEFNWEHRKVTETGEYKQEFTHNGQTFELSGRSDGEILVGDEWMYLELKSVDAYKYTNMRRAYLAGTLMDFLRKEWPSYIEQCNAMMAMNGLKKAYIVIINRSNCQFGFTDKKFQNPEGGAVLEFDPELWEQQKTKMAFITRKTEAGELPMRGALETSKMCSYCAYKERCWSDK